MPLSSIRIAFILIFRIVTAQRNLSQLGNASQSSTFSPYTASLAVTGGATNEWRSGSCSHTGSVPGGAWWMLKLPNNTMFIEQVTIFYPGEVEERFDGYSLYLSNTSISGTQKQTPPGILCYKDVVDGQITMTERRTCNQMAQYIIIYTDNVVVYNAPFLYLCDVQIMGCSKQQFGIGCSKICSLKCFDQHCYPSSGRCVWGCNCFNNDCDGNEFCTECKKGFMGQYCNQECSTFSFGQDCIYTCHCNNPGGCDNIDGICLEGGCQAGWQGGNCSTECNLGHYGHDCQNTCHGCLSSQCYNTNGECIDKTRCSPGWKTELPYCNTLCSFRTFGDNCSHQCHCRNQLVNCNPIDGTCPAGGCQIGWQGSNCNTECPDGTYGFGCLETCRHCFNNTCDKVTGACSCPQEIVDGCCIVCAENDKNKYDSSTIAITIGIGAAVIVIQAAIIVFLTRRQKIPSCVMCKSGSRKAPTDRIIASNTESAYELSREPNDEHHSYSTLRTVKKNGDNRTKSNDGIYEIPGKSTANL